MFKKVSFLSFLISLAIIFFLSGCYHLVGSGTSEISSEIESIAIPIFKNKTDVPGIELVVTDAMIKEFTAFSPEKITDIEHAKTVIQGKVISYSLDTVAADKTNKVLEYRLRMKLEISLTGSDQNNVIYENKQLDDFIDFKVPRDSISRKRQEENARIKLAQQLSQKLITELFEGF